ncbi:MAG: hypothetical protein RLZZ70_362 [Candidatus Parcubacteria bacterium]
MENDRWTYCVTGISTSNAKSNDIIRTSPCTIFTSIAHSQTYKKRCLAGAMSSRNVAPAKHRLFLPSIIHDQSKRKVDISTVCEYRTTKPPISIEIGGFVVDDLICGPFLNLLTGQLLGGVHTVLVVQSLASLLPGLEIELVDIFDGCIWCHHHIK